jgi:hypothetical protein
MATFATRSPAKVAAPRKREVATSAQPAAAELQIPHEVIAKRAFEKFAARGYLDGFHEQDWFDAEDELRAEFREQL